MLNIAYAIYRICDTSLWTLALCLGSGYSKRTINNAYAFLICTSEVRFCFLKWNQLRASAHLLVKFPSYPTIVICRCKKSHLLEFLVWNELIKFLCNLYWHYVYKKIWAMTVLFITCNYPSVFMITNVQYKCKNPYTPNWICRYMKYIFWYDS